MNAISGVIVFLAAAALLALPRRWGLLPILVGTCYIPFYVGIDLAGFNLNAVRMMIAVGILRIAMRGELPAGGANGIDFAMLAWAVWLLASSFFHDDPSAAFKFRLGLAYDALGVYAIMRGLCRSVDDALQICRIVAIALVPLALEMLYEKTTGHNLFGYLRGFGYISSVREGQIRANGPFGHAILAGTVGGVSLPLMVALWKRHRRLAATAGIAACLAIVFSSGSSGPILSALAGLFALSMWRFRHHVRSIQLMAVAAYIALDTVMKDPAYFLVARIDLVGGSTSWYRAKLIQSAFEHLDEWWLTGTDVTRHWMWVAMPDPNQTDITNHYIQMGVLGGLPLMLLFISVLFRGFAGVTRVLRREENLQIDSGFLLWTFGSSIFAIAFTGLSVTFHDQSLVFIYVVLGTIGSAWSIAVRVKAKHRLPKSHPTPRVRVKGRAHLHPSTQLG